MELIEAVIPIITFFMGATFTYYRSQREKRRKTVKDIAVELSDLVNDWNSELHKVIVEIERSEKGGDLAKELYLQLNDRMILPKLIRSLEVLRRFREAQELCFHAESFLRLVSEDNVNLQRSGSIYTAGDSTEYFARELGTVRPLAYCSPCWMPSVAYNKINWYVEKRSPATPIKICRAGMGKQVLERLAQAEAPGALYGVGGLESRGNEGSLFSSRGSPDVFVLDTSVLEIGEDNAVEVFLLILDKVTQDVNKETARLF